MTTYAPGVPPQNRNPQSIGFLLLDNFTLISLASAVEPLRMANRALGARTLPLAHAEPGRPPGLGQRRSADHPRRRYRQRPGGGLRDRLRRRRHPAQRHPRARHLPPGPGPPGPTPRRGVHRQLGAGPRRPARRLRLQRALGMPGGDAGSLPAGSHEYPSVLDRPQPLHLLRRHRADGHDAAPDRPRAWPRAVGSDLRDVHLRAHPQRAGPPARAAQAHARHQPAEVAGDRRADGGEPGGTDRPRRTGGLRQRLAAPSSSACSRSTCTARRRATT